MTTIAALGDIIGLVCFSAAFVIVAMTREVAGVRVPRPTKVLLLAAILVYIVVTSAEPIAALGGGDLIRPVEDNIETLFPVLVLGAMFTAYMAAQYEEMARTKQALLQTHELLNDVVDAAPAGIAFLDATGHVVFANDTARSILEITEDDETGGLGSPGWVLAGVEDARPGNLAALVRDEPFDARSVWLTWPTGRTIGVHMSGRPLADSRGGLGGLVVTFGHPHQVLDVPEPAVGWAE